MLRAFTAHGAFALVVTPPSFLHGHQPGFGDCDSVDKLFGHGQLGRIFNETLIRHAIIPAQRTAAAHLWNVGLFDLHALTQRPGTGGHAIYRDCCHLKTSALSFDIYVPLFDMLSTLRTEVVSARDRGGLCASARCKEHNLLAQPAGAAPYAEPYALNIDSELDSTHHADDIIVDRATASTTPTDLRLPLGAQDRAIARFGSSTDNGAKPSSAREREIEEARLRMRSHMRPAASSGS
mmetsp:Transcript_20715/g.65338  ORF Transcript_20715/g.65338 Transcript_20715/m.65338 type:complete len:237 (+) Transcript_20715:353-1063(+)